MVELRQLPQNSDNFHELFLKNGYYVYQGDPIEVVEFRYSTIKKYDFGRCFLEIVPKRICRSRIIHAQVPGKMIFSQTFLKNR